MSLLTSPRGRLIVDVLLVLLVFGVAIGPRLDLAASYAEPIQSEETLYNRYATPYAQGEGYEPRELYFPWHPFASFTHRPPGYVMFLGGIYRAAGIENFEAVRNVQAWMDASSMVMILLLGILVYGGWAGRLIGVSSALFMSQYDYLTLFVQRILSETLYLWLTLVFMVLALLALKIHRPALSLLGGIFLGLANITRPFMVFVLPGYLLWLFMKPRLEKKRAHMAMAMLGMFLAVAPVTYRNYQFHGKFILISTNSGFTLFKSLSLLDNLEAPEELPQEDEIRDLDLGEVAEQAKFREVSLAYMRNHPGDVPKIYKRKLSVLWAAKGGHKISHVLMNTPDDPWLYPLTFFAAVLSFLYRPTNAWHPRLLLLGSIASQYLVCLVANAETRYRVPIVPLMTLLGFWLLWGPVTDLFSKWQSGRADAGGPAVATAGS